MIYQISAGINPPIECELAVRLFYDYLASNYPIDLKDRTRSKFNPDNYRSIRFTTEEDLMDYIGTIEWICNSPYRKDHKRKNWFITFGFAEGSQTEEFDEEGIVFTTLHSSGKGGQNINKVETGVRAIYIPIMATVVCTEERSQYANKQKAIKRLKEINDRRNEMIIKDRRNLLWKAGNRVTRGNANIVFEGLNFERRK